MNPTIRLAFADFWPGFDPADNYFMRLLGTRYNVELCDDPDYLIFSCFGRRHRAYDCVRIFYTGENLRPDFRTCDYAFTFDYRKEPNHFRLPYYVVDGGLEALESRVVDPERILAGKTRFCNFVYSNGGCRKRNNFFHKLSRYKQVDSGGQHLNNVGGSVTNKEEFIRQYKFTIAFENASYPGYTTEKMTDPLVSDSLPIYWGNPLVQREFDPNSFINYHDYGSDEAVIQRIIEVDRDDELYLEYLRQRPVHKDPANGFQNPQRVLAKFSEIFQAGKTPLAQLRRRFHRVDRARSQIEKTGRRILTHTLRALRRE